MRRSSLWNAVLLAVALALAVACARRVPPPPPVAAAPAEAVCFACFWDHQEPGFKDELAAFYEKYATPDPLIRADVRYLLGRVLGDRERLCGALHDLEALREQLEDPRRRLLADETLAFTAGECGGDASHWFGQAAASARGAGEAWKGSVYEAAAGGTFRPAFGETPIRRRLDVPADAVAVVLGESAIVVAPQERVAVQVERTVRDWLSYQMTFDMVRKPEARDALLTYHEGARLRDLLAAVDARVEALPGTIAVRRGGTWYAPDEEGVFRFEVLPDKIQYPTTRIAGDLALLLDTHGISSLVQSAVGREAALVVGCGDHPAKMQAAYHLARRGTDVYFPCDRFVSEVIGYEAPGVLVGSAPIRKEGERAVIGGVPVTFRLDETIVVENADLRGRFQYYDAPARYFRALGALAPLKLEWVSIEAPGQSARVVQRARDLDATAIAVRVQTREDYEPVRDWLVERAANRAVLFHTAPYSDGYRLFSEFPGRTTFGDPRPRFLRSLPETSAARVE